MNFLIQLSHSARLVTMFAIIIVQTGIVTMRELTSATTLAEAELLADNIRKQIKPGYGLVIETNDITALHNTLTSMVPHIYTDCMLKNLISAIPQVQIAASSASAAASSDSSAMPSPAMPSPVESDMMIPSLPPVLTRQVAIDETTPDPTASHHCAIRIRNRKRQAPTSIEQVASGYDVIDGLEFHYSVMRCIDNATDEITYVRHWHPTVTFDSQIDKIIDMNFGYDTIVVHADNRIVINWKSEIIDNLDDI